MPDHAATPIPLRTDDLPQDHKLQMQFALGAFGSVKGQKIVYVSVPVTSGDFGFSFDHLVDDKSSHDGFFPPPAAAWSKYYYHEDSLKTPVFLKPEPNQFASSLPPLVVPALQPEEVEAMRAHSSSPTLQESTGDCDSQAEGDDDVPRYHCMFPNCPKSYRYKADLKFHVRKLHKDEHLACEVSPPRSTKAGKPHPCPVVSCPSGFVREKDLKRHLRSKHGVYARKRRRELATDSDEEGDDAMALDLGSDD